MTRARGNLFRSDTFWITDAYKTINEGREIRENLVPNNKRTKIKIPGARA
jgi:hypothetical protein